MISVVIPVHGVEDYLDQCLDSVLSDPSVSLEVIAVDDASPDGCGAILAARHDPRLRVLTTRNLTSCRAARMAPQRSGDASSTAIPSSEGAGSVSTESRHRSR